MKAYSRKQAGVIYKAVKNGELEMGKDAISVMYDFADEYIEVYDNLTAAMASDGVCCIKKAVDAIFNGDMAMAQIHVGAFEETVIAA